MFFLGKKHFDGKISTKVKVEVEDVQIATIYFSRRLLDSNNVLFCISLEIHASWPVTSVFTYKCQLASGFWTLCLLQSARRYLIIGFTWIFLKFAIKSQFTF